MSHYYPFDVPSVDNTTPVVVETYDGVSTDFQFTFEVVTGTVTTGTLLIEILTPLSTVYQTVTIGPDSNTPASIDCVEPTPVRIEAKAGAFRFTPVGLDAGVTYRIIVDVLD